MDTEKENEFLVAGRTLLLIAVWIVVDCVMQFANYLTGIKLSGEPLTINTLELDSFIGDRGAYGDLIGRWLSLTIPFVVMITLALLKVKLTWRLGLYIGLSIVLLQWIMWMGVLIFQMHLSILAVGIQFYISRFFVVLPGIMAVTAVSKIKVGPRVERSMKRKKFGFTLLELLVVIAIIAVVASILFPAIARSKSRAYITRDIAQMRQIYLAENMYESDNGDLMPTSLTLTRPYVSSLEIYISPMDPFAKGIPGVAGFPANICALKDKSRSDYRISYPYLPPVAKSQFGLSMEWSERIRNEPTYGMIVQFMDNDTSEYNTQPSQNDYWRFR